MKNKIKVSDYIVRFIEKIGVEYVFLISGGGCIHLIDSVGKAKKIKFVCNHHEQACAIAAEGYARITGKIGTCIVTTGPGATNAVTGVMGAWLDSVPMLIISGQIRRETIGAGKRLRQLGDQEINIVDIVKPITKYAVMVKDPYDIRYHLEKATYLASHGRPGPVWIDIPLDIQGSYIDEKKLKKFNTSEVKLPFETDKKKLRKVVSLVIEKLKGSKRPVLFAGNGVRYAGAADRLMEMIRLLKIPVLTGFASLDLVSPKNPYSAGKPGTIGQRGANFTLQNSDFLLIIGARLNIRIIGYNFPSFARAAYKIMVDVDKEEMKKRTLKIDLPLNFDAKDFIDEMIRQLKIKQLRLNTSEWLEKIKYWQKKYKTVLPEYWKEKEYVNPYCFIETLSKFMGSKDVLGLADATASICTYQALDFPQGARVLTSSGSAPMGYGLPASIGACFARGKKKTICLEGDGSIQVNIQELETLINHKLPIKLFLYSNGGYVSIRLTQKGLFEGRIVASSQDSGVGIPNMLKIAKAYGFKTERINNHAEMERKIKKVLSTPGPVFCEVMVSPDQGFWPKAASMKLPDGSFVSRPLEDMAPFLSREELKENMLIPLWNKV
ncbi:thiamine pyrophosphate-binding protein [Candidatus Roizmanbacteria bacterium]|nr:thiamine pyrophosphate-binding protein [Candidatus Roizmanbacteria bacterium]